MSKKDYVPSSLRDIVEEYLPNEILTMRYVDYRIIYDYDIWSTMVDKLSDKLLDEILSYEQGGNWNKMMYRVCLEERARRMYDMPKEAVASVGEVLSLVNKLLRETNCYMYEAENVEEYIDLYKRCVYDN